MEDSTEELKQQIIDQLEEELKNLEDKKLCESDASLTTALHVLTKHKKVDIAKKLFDKIDLGSLEDHCELLHTIINVREVGDDAALNLLKHMLDTEGNRLNAGDSSGQKEEGVEKDVFLVASQQVSSVPAQVDLDIVRLLISTKKVSGLKESLADLALFMLDEKYVNERSSEGVHASNIEVKELRDRSKLFNDQEGRNKEWMIEILKNYQLAKTGVDLGDVLAQLKLQHGVEISKSEVFVDLITQEITALKEGESEEVESKDKMTPIPISSVFSPKKTSFPGGKVGETDRKASSVCVMS